MNKQKLTLDPKLAEFCEATLTVYDPEPMNQPLVEESSNFKTVSSGKLSANEVNAHKMVRAVAPLVAGQKDVAVTEIKCLSVEGDVLPAEFQMQYEFRVANYSDESIDVLPVTIYFNTPDHALVEQGTTQIRAIPAGWYQSIQFTFPGVAAGSWKMSLEANKPRMFEESNYNNNLLSKTFTYVNQAELIAESVSAVGDNGDHILFYDVDNVLEFELVNVGPIAANNVLVQVPAAFQDNTGTYSTKLAETRMDIPAHTRRKLQLPITFTKAAKAQIGLMLNGDRACNEISYTNNQVSTAFNIVKYNPETGGEEINISFFNQSDVPETRMQMPLYNQAERTTWNGINDEIYVDKLIRSGCGICAIAMALTYMENREVTPATIISRGAVTDGSVSIDYWDKVSSYFNFNETSLNYGEIAREIVEYKIPVCIYMTGGPVGSHFVIVNGFSGTLEHDEKGSYNYDNVTADMLKIADPYKGTHTTLSDAVGYYGTIKKVRKIRSKG